jgi:F-type H+-transporting ATPase subunit b
MTHLLAAALVFAEGVEAPEPRLLGLDAEHWVWVGLTIFLVLAFWRGKIVQRITTALDSRIADTRKALDEAQGLRTEAEALLADAKAKTGAAADEVKAILAAAEEEGKALVAKAESDAKDLIARRTQMAQDKIIATQAAAVADVRAKAASATAVAARKLIMDGHGAAQDKALIADAVARLN